MHLWGSERVNSCNFKNFNILGKVQNVNSGSLSHFRRIQNGQQKQTSWGKGFLMKHAMLFLSLGLLIIFSVNSSKPSIWVFLIITLFLLVDYRVSPVESHSSHLNFRYCTCLKQGVSWHSGNCKVWIHSKTRMWHDKNIQSNAPCI